LGNEAADGAPNTTQAPLSYLPINNVFRQRRKMSNTTAETRGFMAKIQLKSGLTATATQPSGQKSIASRTTLATKLARFASWPIRLAKHHAGEILIPAATPKGMYDGKRQRAPPGGRNIPSFQSRITTHTLIPAFHKKKQNPKFRDQSGA